MYTNILIPIDLAHKAQAGKIIQTAMAIAGNDTKLTLFFAMPEIPAIVGLQMPPDSTEKAKADAEQQLRELAKTSGAPATTSLLVTIGRPHHRILEMVEHHDIDLIVMASHQPELSDYLLGSVAASVVRHAKCSVHVVR